ncbi:MAG: LacI family DNA-binding transcriptional regulator [Devosia sp.]
MAKSTIRLSDIADKTGFSTNTVSLALRESSRIPEETRVKIRAAAVELGYLPNHIAKSLVSRETRTIGLVLTDLRNPIITHTAQAVEVALAERGYGTLFATSNNTFAEEAKVVEMFRSRQVDGILIYPARHRELEHLRPLRRANYPIVLLIADPDSGLDGVSVNDRSGGMQGTRYLIGRGHRRIGFLDASSRNGNLEKLDGYQQALADHGITFDPALVMETNGHYSRDGYFATDTLMAMPHPPTAIIADNDSIAIGTLHWCHKHKVRVPQDLAVMGFDNIAFGEFSQPPLSTINYDVGAVARMAVDRLMRLIGADDQLPEPRVTLIDPELIIREST